MNQKDVDLFYLKKAYEIAMKRSDDSRTNNGAVLVKDNSEKDINNIVAKGANNFPEGVVKNNYRLKRSNKYPFMEHAERNCIYNAAKYGIKTEGLILYCPWFACSDCSRAIIQAGVKKAIGHRDFFDFYEEHIEKDKWSDSIETALNMLEEAGVEYRFITGNISDIEIKVAGDTFNP